MKTLIILFAFLFLQNISMAQLKPSCDSLIKVGVNQLSERNHLASLENLNKAFVMAKENRWHDQSFLALNNIGANYYALLNYGEALHYYLEAYETAIKYLDQEREMIVLNNIALLYLADREYKKAAEYGERAFNIAMEAGNQKRMALYGVNVGLIYNKLGEVKKAQYYFQKVKEKNFPDPYIQFINRFGQAENTYLFGSYSQALASALPLVEEVEKKSYSSESSAIFLLLSKIYLKEKEMAEAVEYCQKSIEVSQDIEAKLSGFEHLASIYLMQAEYKNVVAAKDSLLKYSDSLHKIKNGNIFESNKLSFEIKKHQQDAAHSSLKLRQERKFHYTLLGGIAALGVSLVLGFRNSHLKNKQKKEVAEKEKAKALLELHQKESERLLFEKQILHEATQEKLELTALRNEIESKNRKLSTKALYVSERNEIIQNVLEIVESQDELVNNIKVKKELRKLKELIKTDESWQEFSHHFESVNQGLLDKLKTLHPTLNSNDLRFISYLYMNLSQKEIATILSISPDAGRKRKERISRKLGLADGNELHDYLYSI